MVQPLIPTSIPETVKPIHEIEASPSQGPNSENRPRKVRHPGIIAVIVLLGMFAVALLMSLGEGGPQLDPPLEPTTPPAEPRT